MKFSVQPVQRRADILRFRITVVVLALAQSRAPKIEPQYRIAKAVQRLHGVKNDFVVQRPSVKRMWMAHQRSMSGAFGPHIEQGFQAAGWAIDKQRANRTVLCAHFHQNRIAAERCSASRPDVARCISVVTESCLRKDCAPSRALFSLPWMSSL